MGLIAPRRTPAFAAEAMTAGVLFKPSGKSQRTCVATLGQQPAGRTTCPSPSSSVVVLVVDVVVGGMRDKDFGWFELLQVRLEVVEDLLALVGCAGAIGVGVGHLGDLGEHALEGRTVGPVPVPDGQGTEIRVAEEDELMRVHAEDLGGGHGLLVTDFAHESNGFRHHDDMLAIQEERPFVVIAIREPDDADGDLQGQGLLDDAAAGD